MTIQELFTPRARRAPSVAELLARDLGWPLPVVTRWAAFDAGIRESAGWTEREIAHLCFLRATVARWR